MTGKVDPLTLPDVASKPRPDPRVDWTDDRKEIARAFGVAKLGPADRLRLRAGWRYSQAAADHFEAICREHLVHTKGRWAGEPVEWQPWQRQQWIRPIFGWYDVDGLRAIHRVYIECGKKSGKSTFAAAVAVYFAKFWGEQGAEVYNLSGTEDQARIVQLQCEHMVRGNKELEVRARIRRGADILFPHNNATIAAKSGKGASGHNPFVLVMDELHEWQGTQAYDRWTYGSMARTEWLHLMITNAGDDSESVCWRQREFAQKVESGEIDAPDYMGRVYGSTLEEAEAEIESVANGATRLPILAKCNPGLGTILREQDLIAEIKRAVHIPAELPNLLRFWYCIWRTATKLVWLEHVWNDLAANFTADDLTGPCWLGLDMSSVTDLTALVMVERTSANRYRVLPFFWVPEDRAAELRKWIGIESWIKQGAIEVIPGPRIRKQVIADKICELSQSHDVRAISYDPKEATAIIANVSDRVGLDVIAFRQSHENYHEPTDNFEADCKSGAVQHNGNPVLAWQARHALCMPTQSNAYKKPVKPDPIGAPHKTIDGVQAAVMAYSQAYHYDPAIHESAGVWSLS